MRSPFARPASHGRRASRSPGLYRLRTAADRPDLLVYLLQHYVSMKPPASQELRLAHERAAQPGCSSRALRRSRRARGGRHSPADGHARGEHADPYLLGFGIAGAIVTNTLVFIYFAVVYVSG